MLGPDVFQVVNMRIGGIVLIVTGVIWVVLCFGGIAMMSRSVDFFTEAFLPSLLGIAAVLAGIWMIGKGR